MAIEYTRTPSGNPIYTGEPNLEHASIEVVFSAETAEEAGLDPLATVYALSFSSGEGTGLKYFTECANIGDQVNDTVVVLPSIYQVNVSGWELAEDCQNPNNEFSGENLETELYVVVQEGEGGYDVGMIILFLIYLFLFCFFELVKMINNK